MAKGAKTCTGRRCCHAERGGSTWLHAGRPLTILLLVFREPPCLDRATRSARAQELRCSAEHRAPRMRPQLSDSTFLFFFSSFVRGGRVLERMRTPRLRHVSCFNPRYSVAHFRRQGPGRFRCILRRSSSTPVSKSRVFFPWDGIAPHLEFPKRTRRGQAMLFLTTAIE